MTSHSGQSDGPDSLASEMREQEWWTADPEPMGGTRGLLGSAFDRANEVPEREVIWLCAAAIVNELAAIRATMEALFGGAEGSGVGD